MGCGSSNDGFLYAAAKEGDLEGCKEMLAQGADPGWASTAPSSVTKLGQKPCTQL